LGKFIFNTIDIPIIEEYKIEYCKNYYINDISTNRNIKYNSLVFFNEWSKNENDFIACKECLIIVPSNASISNNWIKDHNYIIYTANPRKAYAIILDFILNSSDKRKKYNHLENYIVLGENVVIGEGTELGPFVFIDHDVKIGSNCIIKSGVKIGNSVEIGESTIIRENSVIGGQGFGIEKDNQGKTYRIPHLGGVIVGSNVEIGALNTVVSGTIDATIIEDYVKTDDHIHIAHNCKIERSTIITACVEISGSVTVGANSTIGPNSSLMDHVSLGENTVVGLGAVVTKSFPPNVILAGNPADTIEKLKKIREVLKRLMMG